MMRAHLAALASSIGLMQLVACTADQPSPPPGGIAVTFKLDRRLADPTRGGDRWLSTPYYGANAQEQVEARAEGIDATGERVPVAINPRWISSDRAMVSVTPDRGNRVTIAVKHAGESRLKVVTETGSAEFVIRAKYLGTFLQLAITEPGTKKPAVNATAEKGTEPATPPTLRRTTEDDAREALRRLKEKRESQALAVQRSKDLAQTQVRHFAAQDGVVTLPSGLMYKVLRTGRGRKPSDGDRVRCKIRMTSLEQTEGTGSHGRTEEATLEVGADRALAEALKLMPAGSSWQIILPPRVASSEVRGRRHRGARMGAAYSAPVFLELELLRIDSPARIPGVRTASTSAER